MATLQIRAVSGNGACVLVLSGEADLATADDITQLGTSGLGDQTTHTLIIDMAGLTFIDSTAISALIRLRDIASETSKQLRLTSVPARVLRILQIAGLHTVFTID